MYISKWIVNKTCEYAFRCIYFTTYSEYALSFPGESNTKYYKQFNDIGSVSP